MTEMYIILGWAGWIWLVVVVILLSIAFEARRKRSADEGRRGFEVIGNNEKQP